MNQQNQWDFDSQYTPTETIATYTAKTFGWMFLGLMMTFVVCMTLYLTGFVYVIYSIPGLHLILLVAQLILVYKLSRNIYNLSVGKARALFFIYAASNGIVFSGVFLIYGLGNAVFVFGLTALYFGGMALFGYFTKIDLSRIGPILISGIIFLFVINMISMFISLGRFETMISLLGIGIFLAVTAYDVQKIRTFYQKFSHDPALLNQASIYFALELYLDFINMFLYLLRFLGNQRD